MKKERPKWSLLVDICVIFSEQFYPTKQQVDQVAVEDVAFVIKAVRHIHADDNLFKKILAITILYLDALGGAFVFFRNLGQSSIFQILIEYFSTTLRSNVKSSISHGNIRFFI